MTVGNRLCCFGFSLFFERTVEFLDFRQRLCFFQRSIQFRCHQSLFADEFPDGFLPGLKPQCVGMNLLDPAKLVFVQTPGDFLAVPRDEWNGRTAFQQFQYSCHLSFFESHGPGNLLCHCLHAVYCTVSAGECRAVFGKMPA